MSGSSVQLLILSCDRLATLRLEGYSNADNPARLFRCLPTSSPGSRCRPVSSFLLESHAVVTSSVDYQQFSMV